MITDAHRDFARAVVALAREHGMNHINMTFDNSSSQSFSKGVQNSWEKVTMNWREGRHGDNMPIEIVLTATQNLLEKLPA